MKNGDLTPHIVLSTCVRRSFGVGQDGVVAFRGVAEGDVGIDDNSKLLGHHEYIIDEGASVEYIRLFYVDALTDAA